MKYRIGSLTTLLIIGLISSASALAGPRSHSGDHGYRSSSQRSASPARQVHRAPPARQVHRAPPARQVRSAPPARHVHSAPPARQVHRAPPARQVHRAPPPPRHVHHAPPPRIVYTHSHHPGRSWRVGRALPSRAVYHEVSAPYYSHYRLAPPPHNHRYVRMGDDILLIAIGTGLIAGAIYDISHY